MMDLWDVLLRTAIDFNPGITGIFQQVYVDEIEYNYNLGETFIREQVDYAQNWKCFSQAEKIYFYKNKNIY